jgi:hypothetical protein
MPINQGDIQEWFIDRTGDGRYDTIISYNIAQGRVFHQSGGAIGTVEYLDADYEYVGGTLNRVNQAIENYARTTDKKGAYGSGIEGAALNLRTAPGHDPKHVSTAPGGYGEEVLDTSAFFYKEGDTIPSGSKVGDKKTREEVFAIIKPLKPQMEDQDIYNEIDDFMPQLGAVSEEDKAFKREDFKTDVYGISKPGGAASKAGAEVLQAQGSGMGASMRTAYTGMKDVTEKFKQAEQDYEKDIYGLKQDEMSEYDEKIETWFGDMFRQGGKVPSNKRQTFSQVLSKIPDAGGT